MNPEDMTLRLPEEAGAYIKNFADSGTVQKELGEEYIIFKSGFVDIYPTYLELLEGGGSKGCKREKAAHCVCTACRNEFHTEWLGADENGRRGIRIFQGEDGSHYPGVYDEFGITEKTIYMDGEMLTCPFCYEDVRLYHSSHFAKPRINQVAVSELINIENQTVIMTWLVKRETSRFGLSKITVSPHGAVAFIGKKLYSYKHFESAVFGYTRPTEKWYKTARFHDPVNCLYYDADSWNYKKCGSIMKRSVPEMVGTSGEKTGLREYVKKGGCYPVQYLKLWKKYPHTENLMLTGFDNFVISLVGRMEYENSDYSLRKLTALDLKKRKPHEILGMQKYEYKAVKSFDWEYDHVAGWNEIQEASLPVNALEYNWFISRGELGFVVRLCRCIKDRIIRVEDYKRIIRYLEKQKELSLNDGLQYLVDHWDMMKSFNTFNGICRELTEEERYPRNLLKAHEDDIERNKAIETGELQRAFDLVYSRFSAVEWNDGELCIIIPKSETELKKEGAVLRHCVGGYGKQHTNCKLIFFVRHYRRPERSYYTLNIDCTGSEPHEIQLHGYGNERHGENKQYTHSIPKKVRDFVDKWEEDVLKPWYKEQMKKALKKEKRTA